MTRQQARSWMRQNVGEYVDQATGEVNCTSLAEACAQHFGQDDVDGPLDDETHWIWDEAVVVAKHFEENK